MICNKETFENLKGCSIVDLECDFCKTVFQRTKKSCYYNVYRKGVMNLDSKCFCGKECKTSYNKQISKQKRICCDCKYCGVSFESLKITSRKFCSQTCSAKYHNEQRGLLTHKKVECSSCERSFEVCNHVKRKKYKCSECIELAKQQVNIKKSSTEKIKNCKNCKECENLFTESVFKLYCSKECKKLSTKPYRRTCNHCNISYRAFKSFSKFCSGSCRSKSLGLHEHAHNKSGLSRSKIELYIEKKLMEDFPELEIKFNDKRTIGSELDIYFPTLKLGIELNGIFHYIPVYGQDVLTKTQNRDSQKLKKCNDLNINLITINLGNCGFTKSYAGRIYNELLMHLKLYI